MSHTSSKLLVLGFGNPGRLDDGLGQAFAAAVQGWDLDAAHVELDYQLQLEHAALVAEHDVVLFADAHVSCAEPWTLTELEPVDDGSFTTHALSPAATLALARTHFGSAARGFLLGIRGYEFNEYEERLSTAARENLDCALRDLRDVIASRQFESLLAEARTDV